MWPNGYNVKIIKDSINTAGNRLTTFELTYPRFVHAELLTHRDFSRSSSSSRAIPTTKLVDRIRETPAMPVWWGKNQKGMQAEKEIDPDDMREVKKVWLDTRDYCLEMAERLRDMGLHKQIANRIIEPWMFITVLVSATNYENWFHLRDTWDPGKPPGPAQPEIAWVASAMRTLYNHSKPAQLRFGQWHLPLVELEDESSELYVPPDELAAVCEDPVVGLKKVSTARCARVSYLTHDGVRDFRRDLELHDHLISSKHWSPTEHIAQALDSPTRFGNFVGWKQYRKEFDNEYVV